MRRIKAVASPSQLCLWDELDEPAAFPREAAAPAAPGGAGPSAPPASAAAHPRQAEARPERKRP